MQNNLVLERTIEDRIRDTLKKQGVVMLLGPRQSGKTTLSKKLLRDLKSHSGYYNCELFEVRQAFQLGTPRLIKELIGDQTLVVFDEAQTIENIGKVLKVFHDTYPDIRVIATGSSSFDLANKIKEPLTGRAYEFVLPPLSLPELKRAYPITKDVFEHLLLYGLYPAVALARSPKEKIEELKKIATNYLYKDVFTFESLRNPKVFEDLLIHLAQSVGSTVSSNALARELGVSQVTVEKYIRLLEQSFVINRIYSYTTNYANELKKSYKIYFYDNGVINVLLNRFDLDFNRGALFENFFFTERLKEGLLATLPPRIHFWRTKAGNEVDFVVMGDGIARAYECKYNGGSVSFETFHKRYPHITCDVVRARDFIDI